MARSTFHLNNNTMNISKATKKKCGKLAKMFRYIEKMEFSIYVENRTHILHSIRILTTPSLIFGIKSIYACKIESIALPKYFAFQFFPPLTQSLFGMNEKFNNKFENQRVSLFEDAPSIGSRHRLSIEVEILFSNTFRTHSKRVRPFFPT